MMGHALDFLLAEVLLLLLLPFLAVGFLLKTLLSMRSPLRLPQTGEAAGRRPAAPARARELIFARAIEAYEELIDTTHLAASRAGRVRQA